MPATPLAELLQEADEEGRWAKFIEVATCKDSKLCVFNAFFDVADSPIKHSCAKAKHIASVQQ